MILSSFDIHCVFILYFQYGDSISSKKLNGHQAFGSKSLLGAFIFTVSSQGMQDNFEAKSANWLAMWIVNLVPNFLNSRRVELCNEVGTFSERWQLSAYQCCRKIILDFEGSMF